MEERYIADREAKLAALLDVLHALPDSGCTVMDLGCGTGSVTRRLLTRLPSARAIALDADPVLLAIASATFDEDERVQVVRADLRSSEWMKDLRGEPIDAVLTATALHWLSEIVVRRLYGELADVVRPGGVFAHLEVMPLAELPRLSRALSERAARRRGPDDGGQTDWDEWWNAAARDPVLTEAVADRQAVFNGNYPTEEFSPPAEWHIKTLRDVGFTEAGVVWRSGSSAIVAAVR